MAKIQVKFKNQLIEEINIADAVVTIGRTEENTIMIDNLGVSRTHAKIYKEGEDFIFEDLGSQNGTTINARRVVEKNKLQDKDEIVIGKHSLTFLRNEEASELNTKKKIRPLRPPGGKFLPAEETLKIGDSNETEKIMPLKVSVTQGDETKELQFEKVLITCGKGATMDIKIDGNFDSEVVFIISYRRTGFFISPTKGCDVMVDQQKITDTHKLKNNSVIECYNKTIKILN